MIGIRISDPRSLGSLCIKGTDESTLVTDSWAPLISHDPPVILNHWPWSKSSKRKAPSMKVLQSYRYFSFFFFFFRGEGVLGWFFFLRFVVSSRTLLEEFHFTISLDLNWCTCSFRPKCHIEYKKLNVLIARIRDFCSICHATLLLRAPVTRPRERCVTSTDFILQHEYHRKWTPVESFHLTSHISSKLTCRSIFTFKFGKRETISLY